MEDDTGLEQQDLPVLLGSKDGIHMVVACVGSRMAGGAEAPGLLDALFARRVEARGTGCRHLVSDSSADKVKQEGDQSRGHGDSLRGRLVDEVTNALVLEHDHAVVKQVDERRRDDDTLMPCSACAHTKPFPYLPLKTYGTKVLCEEEEAGAETGLLAESDAVARQSGDTLAVPVSDPARDNRDQDTESRSDKDNKDGADVQSHVVVLQGDSPTCQLLWRAVAVRVTDYCC